MTYPQWSLNTPSTKPRVVHVTTSHHADDVRIYERECRSLAESGLFEVLIAAPGTVPDHGGVQHIPIAPIPDSRVARITSAWRRARAALRGVEADLYHFHDPELLPLAWWLHAQGHLVVWDSHEDYEGRFSSDSRPLKRGRALSRKANGWGFRALRHTTDRNISAVVAATDGIARRYCEAPTVVVGNEARIDDLLDADPSFDHRRVLFLGSPGPGHLFREVVDSVAATPDLRLAVARRSIPADSQDYAVQKLGDRFEFLGHLGRRELVNHMSRSTVGMVTYAPTPAYMDPSGMPTKLYEFAAAGLPFVGTPVPAVAALARSSGGGLVSRDFTAAGLEEALQDLTGNRPLWAQSSVSARAWMRENNPWKASASALVRLYRDLLDI